MPCQRQSERIKKMKLKDYGFKLPKELIATKPRGFLNASPEENRDAAKLMVVHRDTLETSTMLTKAM